MAQTPPPFTPPASTPSSASASCQWCKQPMAGDAIRCSSCGKLRKDIYNEKIICYAASIAGGLLIGLSFAVKKKKQANLGEFYEYYGGAGGGGGNTTSTVLLILGIVIALVAIYYYVRVSQKIKTYWWA